MKEKVTRGNKVSVLGSEEGLQTGQSKEGAGIRALPIMNSGTSGPAPILMQSQKGHNHTYLPPHGEGLAQRLTRPTTTLGLAMVSV